MPAGRIIAMVAGVLLILGGLGGAALGVGGLVLTAQRHDGYVTGWPSEVTSTAPVVTSETIEIHAVQRFLDWAGVQITATGGGSYFLGVARAEDVDRWLSGIAYDEVVRLDPDGADLRRVRGANLAVAAPEERWRSCQCGRRS